jgi:hypothetical protein
MFFNAIAEVWFYLRSTRSVPGRLRNSKNLGGASATASSDQKAGVACGMTARNNKNREILPLGDLVNRKAVTISLNAELSAAGFLG